MKKSPFPLLCLVFAMIERSTRGFNPKVRGRRPVLGICIGFDLWLLPAIVYLGSLSAFQARIVPWLAAWLPNFLGLGAGYGFIS